MIKSWQERVEHGFSIYAKASALECEIAELRAENEQLREQNTNVDAACAELEKEVERLQERMDEIIAADDKIIALQRDEVERLKQEQANEIVSIEGMPVGMGNEPEQAEPDLSNLQTTTQEKVRKWIADGTFIERAIGVMTDQEKEIVRLEKEQEQAEPAAYFQLVRFGNSLIHEQVVIQSKEDVDVFPLYTAPQGQTELLRQCLEALEDAGEYAEFELRDRMDLYKNYPNLAYKYRSEQESVDLVNKAIDEIKQHLGEA